MGKIIIIDNPAIKALLAVLRDERTSPEQFRSLTESVAASLCYEALRNAPLSPVSVKTPVGPADCEVLARKYAAVPILRAGLGMAGGVTRVIPGAAVWHIGFYRDHETLAPVEYYKNLPKNAAEYTALVLDPMCATGGTCSAAIAALKKHGVDDIKLLCLISSREGLRRVQNDHPDVDIYTAAVDETLNDIGYIVPGLGDAGDRLFGTV